MALLFASAAGAASTIFTAAWLFGMVEYRSFAENSNFSLGYRLGMGLNLSVEVLAALVPATAVCALGLALFGVPVTHWLGQRAARLWVAVLGLTWGVLAGGMAGRVLFKWMFGGDAEWQVSSCSARLSAPPPASGGGFFTAACWSAALPGPIDPHPPPCLLQTLRVYSRSIPTS